MRGIRAFVVGLFVVGALTVAPPAEAATVHGVAWSGAKGAWTVVAKTPGWSWAGVKWLARHA